MSEYAIGFEWVREPDHLLPEGSIVGLHTHNYHHNTHLTMGTWDVIRMTPIVGPDGVQLKQMVKADYSHLPEELREGRPAMVEQEMWHEHPTFRMQGGGPRSIVAIPKNMAHKFILVKGWGFYRCVFAHRDESGNLIETWNGFRNATE